MRIVGDAARSTADVEDDEHRFGADVGHDSGRVTAVSGRALRTPWTTCLMAASQLTELLNTPLHPSPYKVLRQTRLAHQCTHMVDMASLAIAAAARGVMRRQYDAVLTVEHKGGADYRTGDLYCNGAVLGEWTVREGIVLKPEKYAGLEMYRSGRWIEERADDLDEIEAVFVMQRAMLVAGGKRFDLDQYETADNQVWMTGACFAFQASRLHEARRRFGSSRTFSQSDELLADLKPLSDSTP